MSPIKIKTIEQGHALKKKIIEPIYLSEFYMQAGYVAINKKELLLTT